MLAQRDPLERLDGQASRDLAESERSAAERLRDRENEAALADAKAAHAAELDALKASHDAALAAAARRAKRLEAELATTRDVLATTALSRDRAVRDLEERDASTLQDRREDALMDESAKRLDADLRSQVDALRRERDEARLAAAQQKKIAEVASSRRRDRLRSKSPRARPPPTRASHDYVKANARHHARKPHIDDGESHPVLETAAATPSARHPAPAAKPEPGTERSTPRGTSAFAAAAHRRSSDPFVYARHDSTPGPGAYDPHAIEGHAPTPDLADHHRDDASFTMEDARGPDAPEAGHEEGHDIANYQR